jgi:hypothetical protein
MEYWKTHQKEIIKSYLGSIAQHNYPFTLWQQFGEHRYTYTGTFTFYSQDTCKIKIKEDDKINLFDSAAPFYVHIAEIDIIFKKEHYNQMGVFIDFSLPNDIQVHERRKTKRYTYKYQDHKNITYHSAELNPKTGTPLFTYSNVLVDISTQGAGVVISREEGEKLEIGQELLLDNLTDQQLPAPFRMQVSFIESYKAKEKNMYKVGLLFTDQLDTISYKSISSIIDIKQRKTEGLSKKTYCGINDEEQIYIINKIEKANIVLANNIKDNIEILDRLRYMTTHMKVGFLKSINQDLLAVALRLSSKELIYDLFSEVTQTIQEEFLYKLKNERPPSAICKAQEEIIKDIRNLEKNGEIVLDPKAFITYV